MHSIRMHFFCLADNIIFRIPLILLEKRRFFESLRLPLAKGSSTSNQAFLLRRKDVAGSAIAPPEFWSASGAFALRAGWSAYAIKLRLLDATELRLFDAYRKTWRGQKSVLSVKFRERRF